MRAEVEAPGLLQATVAELQVNISTGFFLLTGKKYDASQLPALLVAN